MPKSLQLVLPAIRDTILGVSVYRGFAKLCDLASVSDADVYDRDKNPTGTQRDLSPKHAKDAYDYIANVEKGFWPEVVLCERKQGTARFKPARRGSAFGELKVVTPVPRAPKEIWISRLDGNHRLHFASGALPGFPAIQKVVSFCLAYDLTLEEEIQLFKDINANQRAMNTSHLDNIKARLAGEGALKVEDRDLYIAKQLDSDPKSPLYGRIYQGGKKTAGFQVPLRAMKTGIQYMMSRQTRLLSLRNSDAQYKVVRNYFAAIRKWIPKAFDEPKKYLVLRGAGLWGICFLGSEVIDRALSQGKFNADDMLAILRSGRAWDWSNSGEFSGLSGRGGALKISERIAAELRDDSGVSAQSLYKEIMKSA